MWRLIFLYAIFCYKPSETLWEDITVTNEATISANSTEFFIHTLSVSSFGWDVKETERGFTCTLYSKDGTGVPSWIDINTNVTLRICYITGTVPQGIEFKTFYIATMSEYSFEYRFFQLNLEVNPKREEEYAKFGVRFLFNNTALVELINPLYLTNLIDIMNNALWKECNGKIYVTYAKRPSALGMKVPLNPLDQEGVMIEVAAPCNQSEDLYWMMLEVLTQRNRCPKPGIPPEEEVFFLKRNIFSDWCYYELTYLNSSVANETCNHHSGSSGINYYSSLLKEADFFMPTAKDLEHPDLSDILLLNIFAPALVILTVFSIWLFYILCANRRKPRDQFSEDYFHSIFYICENL